MAVDSRGARLEAEFQTALARHAGGRLDEAERLYRRILRQVPGHLGCLCCLSMVRGQQGRLEEALELARGAVGHHPGAAEAQSRLGFTLLALHRHREAAVAFEQALAINPAGAETWLALGDAVKATGEADRALACYRRAVLFKPALAEAHNAAGNLLSARGEPGPAIRDYELALAAREDYVEARNGLAAALNALGRHAEAIAHFERVLALQEGVAGYHSNYGNALQGLKRFDAAIASYGRALALEPDYPEALNNRAAALQAVGRHAEARADLDRAIALKPDYAETHNNLGNLLEAIDRPDEAIASYRAALAIRPDYAEAWANMANVLLYFGRLDAAVRGFEQAVRLAPRNTRHLFHLSEARMVRPDDPHFHQMEEMARTSDALPENARIELHFALGKAYADLGRQDEAFCQFIAGNRLKRGQVAYDEAAALAVLGFMEQAFTAGVLAEKRGLGDPSERPIFIFGFPRSGTSLVEQMLASHPQVVARGESDAFAKTLGALLEDGDPFPLTLEGVAGFEARQLREIGAGYLRRIADPAPAAARFTDKMTANFRLAGFIHLALPNARLVHIRRDPIDTCVSCFTKLFAGDQPHTYDLAELGHYWRAYDRLMAHWRAVLPAGVMLDVQYETLVGDFEAQARRIVAHCGLPWDPACLTFHKTERAVRTASVNQVRRPIYGSAIGRWQVYRAQLQPLFDALAGS